MTDRPPARTELRGNDGTLIASFCPHIHVMHLPSATVAMDCGRPAGHDGHHQADHTRWLLSPDAAVIEGPFDWTLG